MNKYNLMEYSLAKDAVRDLPKIKKELDETYKFLYNHQDYLAVTYVMDAIQESLQLIERQYKSAKQVLNKKGQE